jgi:hypothetical protein
MAPLHHPASHDRKRSTTPPGREQGEHCPRALGSYRYQEAVPYMTGKKGRRHAPCRAARPRGDAPPGRLNAVTTRVARFNGARSHDGIGGWN